MKRHPLSGEIPNDPDIIGVPRSQIPNVGFTLMELLLAMTLFSIIAVAIYSSLAAGIKVHRKGSNIGGEYYDLRLAFNIIAQDLRTGIPINSIYLAEESQLVSFFSIQLTQDGSRELYKITYKWEREKNTFTLSRLKETYIDSLQEMHPKGDELIDEISQLDFDYGYVKKGRRGEEDFQWKENWKEEAMPRMVRLRIEKGGEKFNKVIYCSAGKLGEVKE